MMDRAGRRAALALLGLVLALGAILLPPATSASSSHGAHSSVAFQALTVRPFRAAVARPASPLAGAANAVHRLLGHAAPLAGAAATPAPAVTTLLGSLLIAAVAGRSRLNGSRRRPRGPPALVPAPAG